MNKANSWSIIWSDREFNINQNFKNTKWANNHLAIITDRDNFFNIGTRWVIVGDVWLSSPNTENPLKTIAKLWEKYQIKTLEHIEGIYNLIIYDRSTHELLAIRDAIGGHPLYYTQHNQCYYFSNKLANIANYTSPKINLIALRDYLCCAFIPGSQTLWEKIQKLRPNQYINLPSQKINTYKKSPKIHSKNPETLIKSAQELRNLLNQIIQEYIPDNQPIGVFLSGGLDSSSITALASKYYQSIHTYSIHFGADCPHELEFSTMVANHCQTNHHILEITFKDMWEKLPQTIGYLDEPIGDPLTVPNYLVGQLAKESVNIILNGEGGDPCFGGPKNQPMLMNSIYQKNSPEQLTKAYLTSFQKCYNDLLILLKPEVWQEVKNQPSIFTADLIASGSYLNNLMELNIKYKGADQILTKVSNLTTANQILGLSPLFDRRIVEFSRAIPPEYKLSGHIEKAVLKEAVKDLLPAEIINRPKSGMMVPVQKGFREFWHKEAKYLLLNKQAKISPYINQNIIKNWLNYEGDIWGRYGVKLWLLVTLEMWLQCRRVGG